MAHPWLENSICCNHYPEDWEWVVQAVIKRIEGLCEWKKIDKKDFRVDQVKEKFGGLRFYWSVDCDVDEHFIRSVENAVHWGEGAVDAIERGKRENRQSGS